LPTRKSTNGYRYQLQTRERITQIWSNFTNVATIQRIKKPAINDNTIADTPPFVEIAPLLVAVSEGSALDSVEDAGSDVVSELEEGVVPPLVTDAPLVSLVAADEEEAAAVDDTSAELAPEEPEALDGREIVRILVVVAGEVAERVVDPETHSAV